METRLRPGVRGNPGLRRLAFGVVLANIALLGVLAVPGGASGESASMARSSHSWNASAPGSRIEALAGRIASRIAGRPVTVRCESDEDWASLIRARGGDPSAESGYVETAWNESGQLLSTSNVAELSGHDVCLALETFANATTKPTKCTLPTTDTPAARRNAAARHLSSPQKSTSPRAGRLLPRLGPCYLRNGKSARPMTPAFWNAYERYAVAILTLAHESIHLGGVVGGQLPNGRSIGDPQAEAKADCYGMQAMAAVAVELGDTPDDAQAIATYFWDKVYARSTTSAHAAYWSTDCRPGGLLDIRPAGATAWP